MCKNKVFSIGLSMVAVTLFVAFMSGVDLLTRSPDAGGAWCLAFFFGIAGAMLGSCFDENS